MILNRVLQGRRGRRMIFSFIDKNIKVQIDDKNHKVSYEAKTQIWETMFTFQFLPTLLQRNLQIILLMTVSLTFSGFLSPVSISDAFCISKILWFAAWIMTNDVEVNANYLFIYLNC